ncbi:MULTISPECIES: EAL domain-containing protein [unclassified Janthinobacterium]|uniref:EAL domain-containing protein n=1 Tax=unclassified Janthinobacterium TaxID=2610881 RepID=UPI0003489AEC|nr:MULTISPECIES: EAL domain-containing protein [unclassified Janthinobacterium]MEC5163671.1 diguanylate cyclase (GGDEF)-like protein/PAS domain S-box-containing protein [Janthinobacterium sp. CG_S6]
MDANQKQASEAPAGTTPDARAAAHSGLQASFDQAPVGIVHLDLAGFFLHANERMCKLLDFAESELVGKHFTRRMVSDDGAALQADMARLLASPGASSKHEVRLIRRGGTLNWAQIASYCIVDAAGQPEHLLWWVSDLEPRRQLKDMLQLSNRALAASLNGVLICDASQASLPIMYANPAFCRMSGYELIDVMGRNCRFLQNDDREQAGVAAVRQAIGNREQVQVVLRNYRKDGTLFWNELQISPVPDERGEVTHYIGILNDITAFKQNEERLAFLAVHDELTGLPNRSLFNDRLRQAILQSSRHANAVALLCLGIDNVNLVNASLGHAAGDQLLRDSAARLLACLRSHHTVSRHGGNEFVIILDEVDSAADITAACDDIFACLGAAFALEDHNVHAVCSIGVTLYPQDGSDPATLLRYADMARARAREQGGGKYQYFDTGMNLRTLERIGIEAALRQAIAGDELQLMYQPLVDLQTGRIASLEALVRWQRPGAGLLAAGEFVPLAEQSGLIGNVGDWVLRRACQDMRAWRDAGQPDLKIAINISPRQFRDPQLAGAVAAALNEFGLGPDALSLEITEAALTEDAKASAYSLAQFKALGVCLTLDDFGTGHSSLSNLKQFAFDLVKIDHAFISDIVTNIDDAALSKTIISMAHNLGIKVVAEGVETEAQCDFLRRNMCDLIQGYFFAAPMAPHDISALLREGRCLPPHLLRMQKQKRTLLLVDDEQNIVASLKRLLRRDDYQIFTANSGQEGLDLLAHQQIDVIVSDQRMPGMIGADFLRAAKQLYPDTIRIMLSGYTELQSVTDAVNEGAIYKFLTKPWEDDLLRGHIAAAFHLKEISDENERLNLEVRTANHELASANRKMEELLRQKQQQISRDEVSLNIARELLQFLPLPVIGMDDDGMIAFINAAADTLFRRAGALLGNEASLVLPDLFEDGAVPGAANTHIAEVDGVAYSIAVYPMGANSASRGSLITLSRCAAPLCGAAP